MIVKNIRTETEDRLRAQFTLTAKASGGGGGGGAGEEGRAPTREGGGDQAISSSLQGDLDETGALSMGVAAADSRPTTSMQDSRPSVGRRGSAVGGEGRSSGDAKENGRSPRGSREEEGDRAGGLKVPRSKSAAFTLFKETPKLGLEMAEEMARVKDRLRSIRRAAKEATKDVNSRKREIDDLRRALDVKRAVGLTI